MYQRTVKITIGAGSLEKLMWVIEKRLVGDMAAASGFVAYLAVPGDKDVLFTTRIFDDQTTLEAEQHESAPVAQEIAEQFEFKSLEAVVLGDAGVYKAVF